MKWILDFTGSYGLEKTSKGIKPKLGLLWQLNQSIQCHFQLFLTILQGWWFYHLAGQPVPVFNNLFCKESAKIWSNPAVVMLLGHPAALEDAQDQDGPGWGEAGAAPVLLSLQCTARQGLLPSDVFSSQFGVLLWKAVLVTLICDDSNFSGI